jgi:hypothetical protein
MKMNKYKTEVTFSINLNQLDSGFDKIVLSSGASNAMTCQLAFTTIRLLLYLVTLLPRWCGRSFILYLLYCLIILIGEASQISIAIQNIHSESMFPTAAHLASYQLCASG